MGLAVAVTACGASESSETDPGFDAGVWPDAQVIDAGPLPLTFRVDEQIDFSCPGADDCQAAYRSFADRHAAFARPITPEELTSQLETLFAKPPAPLVPRENIAADIVDGLNIEFLLEGLDDRMLSVTEYETEDRGRVTYRRLRFEDPHVEQFEVRVLEPTTGGQRSAVIGLHGHGEFGDVFAAGFFGQELAEAGFVVVMPQFRAMDCRTPPEGEISTALLLEGFTLMGLQVYEVMLVLKYLRVLQRDGAVDRIGVISHSGGSSTANLLMRLTPHIDAQVTDYIVDFRNRCPTVPSGVHCETVPALYDVGPAIHGRGIPAFGLPQSASSDEVGPIPRLVVPYGYTDADLRETILDFFVLYLNAP